MPWKVAEKVYNTRLEFVKMWDGQARIKNSLGKVLSGTSNDNCFDD